MREPGAAATTGTRRRRARRWRRQPAPWGPAPRCGSTDWAADPALADLELIFDSDGTKVTGIRTGRAATLETKEPCS